VPGEKLTSIVILGFNEVEYTKLCIDSILKYTNRSFELVLVDNGSSDGTGEYFDSIPGAKVIKNKENLGFAKGCNQGIEASSGEYMLLLNNDVIVTEGWLDNLISCMESDQKIGLVGPMSNFVAGPQQIEVPYGESIEQMLEFAKQFNRRDPSKYERTNVLIGFCLLIRRSVIEKIGLFDEDFGLGNFEDNDYCRRASAAGFDLVRAGDTFIHHFGNRTFIGNEIDWHALMHRNNKIFKEKWGENGKVSTHDLTIAKATLAKVKDQVVKSDPVELYAKRYLQKPWRFPDRYIDAPSLSLAMIVKNEEDNIARCLESVKDAVEEMVVVDTGSTDRTVEIAKSYGAKVFYHEWTGDFSEARNISLDHTSGDWVMFLDADEELVRDDVMSLRELLEDDENEGFFFNELSFIGEKEEDGAVVNLAFRLWRNRPEYRFTGAIHEQIIAKVQSRNPKIGYSNVRINHYGYLNKATETKDKIRRNLEILLREVEKMPDDPFVRFNLGVEYLRLKEYENALDQYKRAFANLSGLDAAYASMLIRNIALCLKELGRYQEALKVLSDAKEAYPDYTDLFFLEGLIYLDQKDFTSAIMCFNICLSMGSAGKTHISQTGVGGYMAAFSLGQAYRALGNEREAVVAYKRALEDNAKDCITLVNLGLMLIDRENPENLRHFFESLVDLSSEDVIFTLVFIFNKGGYYGISLEYLDTLAENCSNPSRASLLRGECLLNLKRYRESAVELANVSASSQFYPSAVIDKTVAHLLLSEHESAAETIESIKDNREFRLIYNLYRSLVNLLNGDLVSISIEEDEREGARRIVADLLTKLLEFQEFEVFEEATKLLQHLDLSSGESSLTLGKIYYDAGFNEIAVEELVRAYEQDCADAEAFFILGRTAFSNEFYEEAKTFFFEAMNRGIEEVTLFISLGRTLIKLGEISEALDVLDIGAKRYPDSPLIAEIKQGISALV